MRAAGTVCSDTCHLLPFVPRLAVHNSISQINHVTAQPNIYCTVRKVLFSYKVA